MPEDNNGEVSHKEKRKQITYNKLKALGQDIISDVEKNRVPSLEIPSRGTGNIKYDDAKKYFVMFFNVNKSMEQSL